jgi:hypothetical protein
MKDYMRENNYRDAVGYVLGDENDPNWAEDMANEILKFNGDGETLFQRILKLGPYGLRQDNCGEAFCRAVNNTPGLPHDGAIAPLQHREYVLTNLRPYIRAVNHYGHYTRPVRQPRGDFLVPGSNGPRLRRH